MTLLKVPVIVLRTMKFMHAADKTHMVIDSVQRASTLKLNLPILKSRQLSSSSLSLILLLF